MVVHDFMVQTSSPCITAAAGLPGAGVTLLHLLRGTFASGTFGV